MPERPLPHLRASSGCSLVPSRTLTSRRERATTASRWMRIRRGSMPMKALIGSGGRAHPLGMRRVRGRGALQGVECVRSVALATESEERAVSTRKGDAWVGSASRPRHSLGLPRPAIQDTTCSRHVYDRPHPLLGTPHHPPSSCGDPAVARALRGRRGTLDWLIRAEWATGRQAAGGVYAPCATPRSWITTAPVGARL